VRFLAHSLFLSLSYYVCALAAWTFIITNQLVATTANVPQPNIE
jgi:hypothetical protein